jgi:hypothetical protein
VVLLVLHWQAAPILFSQQLGAFGMLSDEVRELLERVAGT